MIRKIVKYFLLTSLVALGLIAFAAGFAYLEHTPTFLDAPHELSGKNETIIVSYVAWACDCANWIETRHTSTDPDSEIDEKDCIFIEPASKEVQISESFYYDYLGKKVELVGQFYLDEGIPTTYEMKTVEKPEKAKVFRYDKFRIIGNGE